MAQEYQRYIIEELTPEMSRWTSPLSLLEPSMFSAIRFDDEVTAYLRKVPFKFRLDIEKFLWPRFRIMDIFLRYNSPQKDTTGRIHTDCQTHGKALTHAAIMPILGEHSTGLFRHPKWGERYQRGNPIAFNNPSADWEYYDRVSAKIGEIAIFDAALWHCRIPFAALEPRIVMVALLEEIK